MQAQPARRRNAMCFLPPARRRGAALLWWGLPLFAIGGWFYPYLGFVMIFCMLAPVVVSTVRGRYWCGWVCPRGSFFDYVMGRFSRNKPAPQWLRSRNFRIGMLIFLMTMMAVQISNAWPDPQAIGRVFILLLTVTTVAGIGLALAYKPRTWCSFCPMGTMSSWFAHGKQALVVSDACRNCSACATLCPMGLTPQQVDSTHADCIKCTICVTRCPPKALTFTPVYSWRMILFKPFEVLLQSQSYRSVLYVLLGLPLGLLYWLMLLVGWSLGGMLTVVTIGMPLLLMTLTVTRLLARFERWQASVLLGQVMPVPALPETTGAGFWGRLGTQVRDPALLRSMAYLLLKFPLSLLPFVLALSLSVVSLLLITAPFTYDLVVLRLASWQVTTLPEALGVALLGLICGTCGLHLVQALASRLGRVAYLLLSAEEEQRCG